MGKLADTLNAVEIETRKLCGIGRLLNKSDDEDRNAIQRLLDAPTIANHKLADMLRREGIEGCSRTTIRDHRAGECPCTRATP